MSTSLHNDITRHATVIIVPDHIRIPDYFKAFFPALRSIGDSFDSPKLNETALELFINDAFYGTIYKHESGYYPNLYIPLSEQPATFSVKGVRSGRHFQCVTVPYGTDEYEVVFCEGYPHISEIGRCRPRRESIAFAEYDTTRLLLDAVVSALQPDGEIYRYMTRPEVLFTRPAVIDGGVEFDHVTESGLPVYFPAECSQFISFHSLNSANPHCTHTYTALNDTDCSRLQQMLNRLLTEQMDLPHLEFFTEDGYLCMRPYETGGQNEP